VPGQLTLERKARSQVAQFWLLPPRPANDGFACVPKQAAGAGDSRPDDDGPRSADRGTSMPAHPGSVNQPRGDNAESSSPNCVGGAARGPPFETATDDACSWLALRGPLTQGSPGPMDDHSCAAPACSLPFPQVHQPVRSGRAGDWPSASRSSKQRANRLKGESWSRRVPAARAACFGAGIPRFAAGSAVRPACLAVGPCGAS